MSSLFVDIDRATPVFRLLFSFMQSGSNVEVASASFEEDLNEIVLGLSLPVEARQRLRQIHEESGDRHHDLMNLATQVRLDFKDDRSTLIALLSILIRLCVEDGIICQKLSERLRQILPLFELQPHELSSLSDELLEVLNFIEGEESSPESRGDSASELEAHYRILGCQRASSEAEIRRAYRRLAKEYHPDVYAGEGLSVESLLEKRKNFEAVRKAFVVISKCRGF